MDTPRRLQIASIATAVAGLGLGSLLVGRSPSVEVAPIDLDTAMIGSSTDAGSLTLPVPDQAEIVTPRVREDHVGPMVEATPESLASPAAPQDSPDSPESVDSASD